MGQRLARLDEEKYDCRVYSFRGPRSHRRRTVTVNLFAGDPTKLQLYDKKALGMLLQYILGVK